MRVAGLGQFLGFAPWVFRDGSGRCFYIIRRRSHLLWLTLYLCLPLAHSTIIHSHLLSLTLSYCSLSGDAEGNSAALKPMLPKGTSIDSVMHKFVYKLRESLFNVDNAVNKVTTMHSFYTHSICCRSLRYYSLSHLLWFTLYSICLLLTPLLTTHSLLQV